MMTMDFTVTPVNNVDYRKRKMNDETLISHFYFDYEQDIRVVDRPSGIEETIKANRISMWENELIVNGIHYEVLRVYSKIKEDQHDTRTTTGNE